MNVPTTSTPSPLSLKVFLTAATLFFVSVLVAIMSVAASSGAPAATELHQPTKAPSVCLSRGGKDFQDCCEDQLKQSGIQKTNCAGEWRAQENQCAWVCIATTPTP